MNIDDDVKKEINIEKDKKYNDVNDNPNIFVIEKSKLTESHIEDNICISFNGLKDEIKLFEFIKILEQLEKPLFVDLDRNKNSAILRFNSKKESDSFLRKFYNGGGELLKGMFKYDKINKPRVLSQKENNDYLEMVKEKLQNFKTEKLNKKLKKLKMYK